MSGRPSLIALLTLAALAFHPALAGANGNGQAMAGVDAAGFPRLISAQPISSQKSNDAGLFGGGYRIQRRPGEAPEPSVNAQLLAGFAIVGIVLRSRRRSAITA